MCAVWTFRLMNTFQFLTAASIFKQTPGKVQKLKCRVVQTGCWANLRAASSQRQMGAEDLGFGDSLQMRSTSSGIQLVKRKIFLWLFLWINGFIWKELTNIPYVQVQVPHQLTTLCGAALWHANWRMRQEVDWGPLAQSFEEVQCLFDNKNCKAVRMPQCLLAGGRHFCSAVENDPSSRAKLPSNPPSPPLDPSNLIIEEGPRSSVPAISLTGDSAKQSPERQGIMCQEMIAFIFL